MLKLNYLLILLIFFITATVCVILYIKNFSKHIRKSQTIIENEFDGSISHIGDYSAGRGASDSGLKILVIGNSISSGVIVQNIKDDYINILIRKISSAQDNRKVSAKVYNTANFERHYKNYDYSVLNPLKAYKPDIIIFQLGDNYKREDDKLYQSQFIKLINFFGNQNLRIVTSPYWGQRRKNRINEKAALATNSFYVDISNLFAYDQKTRADYNKKFENEFLGMHPGEYGMKRIAEEIFILVNACMHKNII